MSRASSDFFHIKTELFDGKMYARAIEQLILQKVADMAVHPKLLWVSIGNSDANVLYGNLKAKAAARVGIEFERIELSSDFSYDRVIHEVKTLSTREDVTGLMIQLPIGIQGLSMQHKRALLDVIDPVKDVDCLTSANLGRLMHNDVYVLPATVLSVLRILAFGFARLLDIPHEIELEISYNFLRKIISGKRVLVIGGGIEVGKPLVMLLSNLGATVLWVRSTETHLSDLSLLADIVVCATGVAGLINPAMVKQGVVIIDVGAPAGDIVYQEFLGKAAFITPVPGGVGPVTVASLLSNVLLLSEK